MADVVFPAIAERAKAVTNAQKGKFHNRYRMIQFTPNSQKIGKEYFTVRAVVTHRELAKEKYEYRVRWEGYKEKDNTWQTPEFFSSHKPIVDYWDRLGTTPIDKTQNPHQTRTITAKYISKRHTMQPTPIC
ncbi:hypothetical protein PHYBLDRAFT_172984 [Phycomyces blakesleeanus NRRL 1555(-)]|uniref:Chromo domain-containing protein n=1 Tax=Phycomyces blakesleeanus (strain ATCC 8743b / DSM 1359 / FGSC 10004 / NBRC 33097 / NRRL 1555) TaxID=763407 RepID=A0A162TH69_PHYB8|nr:hypothetical protein PHYBLDRAFT_172984 [Phycomyces blakesleeanus NRRL 1555(-)]OAD68562.1 hypothetical protein PHYBLDRAFT_172984 [Phycomyces blakesleeanus NRRL 1555(-)]|eukprot:XP_018286602.1 hypothetical protein PHYBLDRAFT_172984 [Phycomyces blakesleeanus NRRL 1555(-)]